MTGSQKNVSIFGTLFTCKLHGFWQHVSVNILWFILLNLFEIAVCCNLFGIAKDQGKKDKGIPYQRIPLLIILYHLQSTLFKAYSWNPALWITGSYKLTWGAGKIIIPFSQPSRKSLICSRSSGIKGLGGDKEKWQNKWIDHSLPLLLSSHWPCSPTLHWISHFEPEYK